MRPRRAAALLGLLGALACASPAPAAIPRADLGAAPPATPDAATLGVADELLEASGLSRQLESVAARIRDDLRRRHAASPEAADAIDRSSARAFDAERLRAAVRAALAWFRSPLARRVVALELEAAEPGRATELRAFVAGLAARRPSAARIALLARLDDAGLATETSLDVTLAVVATVARALEASAALEPRLLELRARAYDRMREVTLLGMLFAYRTLADGELARLVAFVESAGGQWFVNATSEVVVRALGAAAEETAPEVARAVRWTGGRTRR